MQTGMGMGELKQTDHQHAGHSRRPYWRHAHRDWRFWVALCFIFAALGIYIVSDNLALVPRQSQPSLPSASK
jgi:hypothetical protein